VVAVAHRLCRQHEVVGKCQWRLSFSRAEIVLINSWMPVQQIVYHMLRYFIKTERLTNCAVNSGAGTLSNYHIKTMMLWACELKPRGWWAEDLNLVRICVELLQTLSVWLANTHCPHYFINSSTGNLLDSFDVCSVASKLMSVNEDCLSTWFISNYIGQCAYLCPVYISPLFDDVSSSVKLQNAVSEIVHWRSNTSLDDFWQAIASEYTISALVSSLSLTERSCVYWINELIDKRLSVYFSAVALLHFAYKITRNGFSDQLLNILSTILGRNFNQRCSDLSLPDTELVKFLQKSAVELMSTYRQLMAPQVFSVATIVTTDFEALYAYKHGDYQRCLQLSTQNVHTLLNACLMPNVPTFPEFIQLLDDDIASLTSLTLIINPTRLLFAEYASISQLTLSLYLITQCQLKLHHSVTSLAQTLDYIKVAQRKHPSERTLDHLTLKLIERKVCLITLL